MVLLTLLQTALLPDLLCCGGRTAMLRLLFGRLDGPGVGLETKELCLKFKNRTGCEEPVFRQSVADGTTTPDNAAFSDPRPRTTPAGNARLSVGLVLRRC
jgi:hypothetical protein